MIRVNLLPGGKKRKARGGGGIKMPSFGGDFADPWTLATWVVPLIAVIAAAWMFTSVRSDAEDVDMQLVDARQDSARYADIREKTTRLSSQNDSIQARVAVIRQIDEGRFTWPHIMDETARALPDYTWVDGIVNTSSGTEPSFEITGMAGNYDAMSVFMDQLEASPFVRAVNLVSSNLVVVGNEEEVVDFELSAQYVQPALEMLETVQPFGSPGVSDANETSDTPAGA